MPPPFPDMAMCIDDCTAQATEDLTCIEASIAFNKCAAELDCPAFEKVVQNEGFGPCAEEFADVDASCASCENGVGIGEGFCSLDKSCLGQPGEAIICMGDMCTCLVGNAMTAMCPANGVCGDLDNLVDNLRGLAAECCGFDL